MGRSLSPAQRSAVPIGGVALSSAAARRRITGSTTARPSDFSASPCKAEVPVAVGRTHGCPRLRLTAALGCKGSPPNKRLSPAFARSGSGRPTLRRERALSLRPEDRNPELDSAARHPGTASASSDSGASCRPRWPKPASRRSPAASGGARRAFQSRPQGLARSDRKGAQAAYPVATLRASPAGAGEGPCPL